MSIPKILHYCWFGGKPLPPAAQDIIQGWKGVLPDYEIMMWSESNFDVSCCIYVRQAYECGKFAFVSDYARGLALFQMGGIYLDTDVELLKSFDPFLDHAAFFGFESGNYVATSTMGAEPGHPLFKAYLDKYQNRTFLTQEGGMDLTTNVKVLTHLLVALGLMQDGRFQKLGQGVACYPEEVFSPYDYINCRDLRGDSTVAIHHFSKTWGTHWERKLTRLKRTIAFLIGGNKIARIRSRLK